MKEDDDGRDDDGWDDEYPDEPDSGYVDDASETLPCPECGEDVYEDAEQCPACGSYLTHRRQISPLWWWTAVMLLACCALAIWWSLRELP